MPLYRPSQPTPRSACLRKIDNEAAQCVISRWLQCRRLAVIFRLGVNVHRGLAKIRSRRHRQSSECQSDHLIVFDIFSVVLREIAVIHVHRFALVHFVVHHVQIHVQDHSEQSIPSQNVSEQLLVLRWARRHHASIAQHHTHFSYGRRNRARHRIDSVGIYAQRSAHAEDIDRLHGLHRETLFVQLALQLPPPRAGLKIRDVVLLVHVDPVKIPQIQH